MIDILNTVPAISANRARTMLNDSLVWFDTFNDARVKKQILDWIRLDQLFNQGVDGNDEEIGFYSLTTSFINPKKAFNTHFTLKDTGDFYASMFIVTLASELIINADTLKMQDQEWWTEKILELNEENMERLREVYKENVIKYAKRVLLEGF